MKTRLKTMTAFSIALAGAVAAPMPMAQSAEAPAVTRNAPAFSDAELKSFAAAVREVQRINVTYKPKLEAATSVEEQQQVQKEAVDVLTQAVQQKGISVDRYRQILAFAQNDPAVANKVKQHLEAVN